MQASSDLSSPSPARLRLSSSLPPQSRVDHYSASSHTHGRYIDPSVDESTRTRAPSRPHGVHRPSQHHNQHQNQQQQHHHRATSVGCRSSVSSQPVIVRTHSAEADEGSSSRPAAMSRRSGSHSNRNRRNFPHVPPPAVEDFGIDGVLRAIEPDIQSTLDAIAQICGRSKLSLANEYGSHRPPLGEIRAPSRSVDHGLLTVEEASSSAERLANENILVVGDDISTLDGRDAYSSAFGLLDNVQSNAGITGHRNAGDPSLDESTGTQQRSGVQRPAPVRHAVPQVPVVHVQRASSSDNVPSTSIPLLWALLGRESKSDTGQVVQTQPVLSEVHIDVEAEASHHHQAESGYTSASDDPLAYPNCPDNKSMIQLARERLSLLSDLRGWLEWCKSISHYDERMGKDSLPSAEVKLRAVLKRHNSHLSTPNSALHA